MREKFKKKFLKKISKACRFTDIIHSPENILTSIRFRSENNMKKKTSPCFQDGQIRNFFVTKVSWVLRNGKLGHLALVRNIVLLANFSIVVDGVIKCLEEVK